MTDLNNNKKISILNTECSRYSEDQLLELDKFGEVININADRQYLIDNIKNFEVILIALEHTIDEEILSLAKNLKCIVTPTTGQNHIDCDFANKKGIDVLSLKGETKFLESISATAELTWGLLLSLIRKIPSAFNDVIGGNWNRERFYGNELKGKIIGIIGFGRLGKIIAKYAESFGMTVIAYDIKKTSNPSNITFMELDELARNSDFISIHLPLDVTTTNLIDIDFFKNVKHGVVLINTSRGEIINEDALLECLLSGRVSAAATDVLSNEFSLDKNWLKRNKLIDYASKNSNLIITPHIGGLTNESADSTNTFIIRKLKNYLIEKNIL